MYTFLNEEDPYEAAKDEVLRYKWIEDSKKLNGDFKPATNLKSI